MKAYNKALDPTLGSVGAPRGVYRAGAVQQ